MCGKNTVCTFSEFNCLLLIKVMHCPFSILFILFLFSKRIKHIDIFFLVGNLDDKWF